MASLVTTAPGISQWWRLATESASRLSRVLLIAPLIQLTYRADAIVRMLSLITRVFLYYVLWSAVYHPGQVNGGIDVRQAITYSTLAMLLVADRGLPADTFSDRMREGTIVYLFLRPLHPLLYYWGVHLGGMSYRAVVMGGGIAIGIAAGIVLAPSSLVLWLGAIVSLFIAELIYGCFFLFLELASFWTVDIRGLRWLFGLILQLLTGALVPIWFFPDWLATLLAWSPFAAAASTPLSIYIGHTPADGVLAALALQIGWLIALVGLAELLWRRARDRVVVQGG